MRYCYVGRKRVDYVSKKTGRPVLGWNLYVTRKPMVSELDRIQGLVAENLYVPDPFDVDSLPAFDCDIDVFFNPYGGIDSVQPA